MKDIMDWQRRFREQPRVFVVADKDECISGVYETREGAQLDADWHLKRGHRMRVFEMNVCSLQLSQERWAPDEAAERAAKGTP